MEENCRSMHDFQLPMNFFRFQKHSYLSIAENNVLWDFHTTIKGATYLYWNLKILETKQ